MSILLAFDTETTGLPNFHEPSDSPSQPHLIQIASALFTSAGEILDSFSTLVKPGAGAVMQSEALKSHGISLERAMDEGFDPKEVWQRFFEMSRNADSLLGHNVSFDCRIMRIHSARHAGFKWEPIVPTVCTMKLTTGLVKMPPTDAMIRAGRGGQYKSPKLSEAYQFFFDEELSGAHDALVDVEACIRIYRRLIAMGVVA